MSDRRMFLPDRALEQKLQNNAKTLGSIERRIMWPGAHKDSVNQSSRVFPVYMLSSGGSYTNITTITLDPGRWLLIGTATVVVTRSMIAGDAADFTAMRIIPVDLPENKETVVYTQQTTKVLYIPITTWSTTVVRDSSLAVTLQLWYANGEGLGSAQVKDTRLTAVPL